MAAHQSSWLHGQMSKRPMRKRNTPDLRDKVGHLPGAPVKPSKFKPTFTPFFRPPKVRAHNRGGDPRSISPSRPLRSCKRPLTDIDRHFRVLSSRRALPTSAAIARGCVVRRPQRGSSLPFKDIGQCSLPPAAGPFGFVLSDLGLTSIQLQRRQI